MLTELESGLPQFINLGTITDAEGSTRNERADLHKLRMTLIQHGYMLATVARNNAVMVHADHWEEYAREWACENLLVGGLESHLSGVIDWPRWAEQMRMDWRPVHIDGQGRFAGTWYMR